MLDILKADHRDASYAHAFATPEKFNLVMKEETRPFREYMAKEAVQQYKDYYESDAEEGEFFEYLDNFTNRDKIRMMELFRDFTTDNSDKKLSVMIQKREFNPQLSVFQNMVLDIMDFKDRVRPLANDIAMYETAQKFQKQNVQEVRANEKRRQKFIEKVKSGERFSTESLYGSDVESGYSSLEAPEAKVQQAAEVEEPIVEEPVAEAQEIFDDHDEEVFEKKGTSSGTSSEEEHGEGKRD